MAHGVGAQELIPVTQVIITALVENVLQHTDSGPDVRLQADGATVTVAVDDASCVQASLRETPTHAGHPWGLRIVSALCRQWGNAPTRSGKTVGSSSAGRTASSSGDSDEPELV